MMKNSLEAQICSNTQLQPKKSSTQKIENKDTCFLSCARHTEQYDRFVAATENKREQERRIKHNEMKFVRLCISKTHSARRDRFEVRRNKQSKLQTIIGKCAFPKLVLFYD
jgi:hypothetical protein